MKKKQKNYYELTVMLDSDVLDMDADGCEQCHNQEEGRCESCQAWADDTADEIEQRVFDRYPGCSVVWMAESEMGSYAAANPYCMECPDDIYEAVLGT